MHHHLLFQFGVAAFGGLLASLIIKRLKIPQVVGYIAFGLVIGESGLGLITAPVLETLDGFNFFALAVIGFLVGSELHRSTFRRYGKQLVSILLCEGLLALVLVAIATSAVLLQVCPSPAAAIGAGIVFGAIASATDPASTLNVLSEYRTAGVLTTTLIAIVALDDSLAMFLYGVGTGTARALSGSETALTSKSLEVANSLLGSLALGVVGGLLVNAASKFLKEGTVLFSFTIALLLLLTGITEELGMDVILAAMGMGVTLVNTAYERSKALIDTLETFSSPVCILFFVFVGARIVLHSLPPWLLAVAGLYVAFRTAGKVAGARLGAHLTEANLKVKRYTGTALFAQGGVAVGLAIMAGRFLQGVPVKGALSLGDTVVVTVTTTTLALQLLGPLAVKYAAKAAGEIGKDATFEDVRNTLSARDIVESPTPVFNLTDPLRVIVDRLSSGEQAVYPVVNEKGRLEGVITFEELRRAMTDPESWSWLIADDILAPPGKRFVYAGQSLAEVHDLMNKTGITEVITVKDQNDKKPLGTITLERLVHSVQQRILSMKQDAYA